jgi:hypothetical protein
MLGFLNTLTAPARSAANQFLRNQLAAGIHRSGLPVLRTARDASKSNLTRGLAAGQILLNQPFVQAGAGGAGAVAAVNASNKTGFTGQIEGALNRVGPALDQLFSGTPQVIQQFGREQEKKGWGGALEMATPFGFLAAPFIPNTQPAPVRRPIANLPADYKQTELAAGAAAEAFRPGAGFPGQQFSVPVVPQLPPEERAYNQERSRIAQLTAATPEERSKLRDEGMRIWAAKYRNLAKDVKPGQSGYEVIQQVLNK